jgi:hypothetical protein
MSRNIIFWRWRFTISELSFEFPQISPTLLYKIITVRLGYYKFWARWIPKMLTVNHEKYRMALDFTFLERYYKDGNEFLNHIVRVTGDETWVICECWNQRTVKVVNTYTFTKRPKKNLNRRLPARKLMATIFWERKGVLTVVFMQRGTAVMSQVYCETHQKFRTAIQNKRRGMLTPGVVHLHDNTRPRTAVRNRELLEHFNRELFDHSPYRPDLSPSYYYLITYLKNWLGSQCFNINEFMECVKTCWANRRHISLTQVYRNLSPIRQAPQFRQWIRFEVA